VGVALAPTRVISILTVLLASSSPVLLAARCGGGTTTILHYHLDRLGSTQAVTNGSGALVGQARYEAYGKTRARQDGGGLTVSGSDLTRHEFTGHESEHASGLIYAGARYYDAELAQFESRDPATQFLSPYAYGPWDPLNGTDPDGAVFLIDDLIIAGLIAAGGEDKTTLTWEDGVKAIYHTHPWDGDSPALQRATKNGTRLPGDHGRGVNDAQPVREFGVPNFYKDAFGNVRVIERRSGDYYVRTIQGKPLSGETKGVGRIWKPSSPR
jgi:RHS repeat-associated protein